MPTSKALVPPHVCVEIKRLYEVRDARGRRVWSQIAIAQQLGLSETTVYRVVNEAGPYQDLARLKSSEEISAAAAESAAKLLRMLQDTTAATNKENANVAGGEATKPADQPAIDVITGKPLGKLPY